MATEFAKIFASNAFTRQQVDALRRLADYIASTGGGGITDHGLLGGLTDNDHPQYSLAGHDHSGVYSPVGHDHSGVYSPVGHTHSAAAVTEPVTVLAISAGVVNIDCSLGSYFSLALNANVTSITFTNLPAAGNAKTVMVQITQDSTPRTVAFPASFDWAGGVTGVVSVGSGARDLLAITSFDQGSAWLATLGNAYA